ncbi:MAG: hypothetical protein IJE68_04840 [Clostridia bacterium]|nr:hypothetical protein [Clostridia bacterium]
MNRISFKLLSVLAIFLFIAIAPIAIFAANEDVSIVSTINDEAKQEYIIYIKEASKTNFKYAFTTNANPTEMDLSYINSISDLGENQVAFLDADTYEKLLQESSTIYMWAKNEEENLILNGIQLDLSKAITEDEIKNVESLTSKISVKIAENEEDTTTIKNETVDGVEETTKVGYVQILDEKEATYYYEIAKLPGEELHNQLKILAEKVQNEYDKMDMYEKVQFIAQFNETFSKVTDTAEWLEVKDMMITQPETSTAGDEYIILLKKVYEQGAETLDVQFLTAFDAYRPNVVTEQIVTQETTKLPITYDSIALFVILGIIVILVIAVFLRMKKLNKQNEEK